MAPLSCLAFFDLQVFNKITCQILKGNFNIALNFECILSCLQTTFFHLSGSKTTYGSVKPFSRCIRHLLCLCAK